MASKLLRQARLIAVEGACGPKLAAAAGRLLRVLRSGKATGGVSEWDASNIFFELGRGDPEQPAPSPRTLLLLYAADLAFRLRWEILPALKEGKCVIAAPYIESAVAFGRAAGLPQKWLESLFVFAPKPQVCYRVKGAGRRSDWIEEPSNGYLEFCCATLRASSPRWDPAELYAKFTSFLDALERRRGCQTLTAQALKDVAQRRKAAKTQRRVTGRKWRVEGPKSKVRKVQGSKVESPKSKVKSPKSTTQRR